MNIEEKIKNCEIYLKQINQYDPDPYYVNYFFTKFIESVIETFDIIFEEANRDFGLFISGKISQKEFDKKAITKNDQKAIKFSEWYLMKLLKNMKNHFQM